MNQAYIVDALRTPVGRRRGALSGVHAADLGAHVLKHLVERNAIPSADYDDVIFGCVDAVGPNAGVISRTRVPTSKRFRLRAIAARARPWQKGASSAKSCRSKGGTTTRPQAKLRT